VAGRAARLAVRLWQAKGRPPSALIEQIIAKRERRILAGEAVSASDKLVRLIDPDADIIRQDSEIAYGHKLNLTIGRSGLMMIDPIIEADNSANSEHVLPITVAPQRAYSLGGLSVIWLLIFSRSCCCKCANEGYDCFLMSPVGNV
jgi:hypothetical protein